MFRIELLSMPFAAVNYPSLALTQLKYIIEERFHDKADIHIRYINHDFARHIGYKIYLDIAENGTPSKSDLELDNYNDIGLKEWMFRQIAFPDTRDNAYEYWNEFLHYEPDKIKKILQIRSRIKPILLKIIEEYDLAHSNIVGFCSMFDQQLASLAMAQLLKEENPEIITLMGGCSCEYPAGQEISKQCKSIDYIFSGQAYQSFPELVGMLLEGKRDIPVAIPGVFCKHQQHSAAQTQKKFRYGNADTELDITNLDYDAFFASLDSNLKNENVQPVLFFETSRGCLWAEKKRCTFCDVNRENKKYKIMHPQKAIEMFQNLLKYKDRCRLFWSTDSMIPVLYLDAVFPHIKNLTKDTKIFYETRVTLSKEQLEKMANNNIRYVQAGIESLSDTILERFHKGTTCIDNLKFLKNCVEYNIRVLWNILSGSPGETHEDYKDQLKLIPKIVHLPPPSGIWAVSYQRNTEYHLNQKHYGIKLTASIDTLRYLYPFADTALHNMAYNLKNENIHEIFTMEYMRIVEKINYLISKWKEKWIHAEKSPPILTLCGSTLTDTRFSEIKKYQLDESDKQILELLEDPQTEKDLTQKISIDTEKVQESLRRLNDLNLLYFSKGRYFSLVNHMAALKEAFIPESFHDIV